MICRYSFPIRQTSGVSENSLIRPSAKKKKITNVTDESHVIIIREERKPFRTLSALPAPKFCPAKLVKAEERFNTNSKAIDSILDAAEYAATASVPNLATKPSISICDNATTDCCTPVGKPIRSNSRKVALSKYLDCFLNLKYSLHF